MKRFVEGADRGQSTLLPECLDERVEESNSVRVIVPRFPCVEARPVFRIGRVPPSLFLAGKMSHRSAVSLDGPPTFRRPMWPGLYRHHLIGFVGIVGYHFPFAFSPRTTSRRMSG